MRAVGFLIIVLLSLLVLQQVFSDQPLAGALRRDLPAPLAKAIDIDLATTQQMATLAVAVIGGLATLVLSKDTRVRVRTRCQFLLFAGAGAAAFCSLYGAYFLHSAMAETLTVGLYTRDDPFLTRPRTVQFYAFLIAVGCFTALLVSAIGPARRSPAAGRKEPPRDTVPPAPPAPPAPSGPPAPPASPAPPAPQTRETSHPPAPRPGVDSHDLGGGK
jgi:hypothetical protein